jgi:hypothetical protein
MYQLIQKFYGGLETYVPDAIKRVIPQSWRIWLGYRIKVPQKKQSAQTIDVPALRLAVPVPHGHTRDELFNYLAGFYLKESGPLPELVSYLDIACDRFLYTVDMVPQQPGKLLEIGAGPISRPCC